MYCLMLNYCILSISWSLLFVSSLYLRLNLHILSSLLSTYLWYQALIKLNLKPNKPNLITKSQVVRDQPTNKQTKGLEQELIK